MNIVDLKNIKPEENVTKQDLATLNPQRRQFLKFILIGIGGFFLGRLFGPIIKFLKPPDSKEVLIKIPEPEKKMELQNWKVIEGENQITFIDKKTNEEVLILD